MKIRQAPIWMAWNAAYWRFPTRVTFFVRNGLDSRERVALLRSRPRIDLLILARRYGERRFDLRHKKPVD